MEKAIEYFKDSKNQLMALLIRKNYKGEGIEFLTDEGAYQQVAYMSHPAGHNIVSHYHNKAERMVDYTCETLIIRKGILEVVLYEKQMEKYRFQIHEGEILTLYSGGHGFQVMEAVEMVEVKQGPFMGPEDKTRF